MVDLPTVGTVSLCCRPLALSAMPGRVSVSNGTVDAVGGTALRPYLHGARLPGGQFVPVSGKFSAEWSSRDGAVGLLQLFDVPGILRLQAALSLIQLRHEASRVTPDDPFVRCLLERIRDYCSLRGPIDFYRLTADEPELRTTSQDPLAHGFVGMHIDAWDDRGTGVVGNRNRLCINFGPEDRYFLFVDAPVSEMRKALSEASDTQFTGNPSEVGRCFMQAFPSYPVTRLRVRPGEAYVAPTCAILHDASTIGATQRIMHAAIRAYIDVRV